MLYGLSDAEREAAWEEIAQELRAYETAERFEGPCDLAIGVGANRDDLVQE